jgi:hypothetical protein
MPDGMTLAEQTTRKLLLAGDPPPAVIRAALEVIGDWNRTVLERAREVN